MIVKKSGESTEYLDIMMNMGTQALVLNASFEPIHVVSWQKAIQLLFQGKVEVLEESDQEVRSVRLTIRVPVVLRLLRYIPLAKMRQAVRFSRNNVFIRDSYQCQYCGKKAPKSQLTLDHVVPVVKGGKRRWNNIVTCCRRCNQKKGGHTPAEVKMKLKKKPEEPRWLPQASVQFKNYHFALAREAWAPYLQITLTRRKRSKDH